MKRYDKCLIVSIATANEVYTDFFPDGDSVRDALSWMKDTYCISDDSMIYTEITYRTTFKRSKDG